LLTVVDFAIVTVRVRIDLFAWVLVTPCGREPVICNTWILVEASLCMQHSKQQKSNSIASLLWSVHKTLSRPHDLAIADHCNFYLGDGNQGPLSISLSTSHLLLVYSVNFEHAVLHYNERNDYIEILSISVILSKM